MLALLRLGDPGCGSGRVLLAGVDVATLPRSVLRSSVAVIPQEGTLFAGTLRFNLDPTGALPDASLLAALRLSGLDKQ